MNNNNLKHFEDFWAMYPRKVSKHAARELWKKKKLDNEYSDIIKALPSHIKQEQWQSSKFIPHAVTWLRQRRWEDEIDTCVKPTSYMDRINNF